MTTPAPITTQTLRFEGTADEYRSLERDAADLGVTLTPSDRLQARGVVDQIVVPLVVAGAAHAVERLIDRYFDARKRKVHDLPDRHRGGRT